MKRVFLTVMDACGIGWQPDANLYGDKGANTIGHTVETSNPSLPNMARLGLGRIPGSKYDDGGCAVIGGFGRCMEVSAGKDTTTGHWEIAGLRIENPFPLFPNGFPEEFIHEFEKAIGHEVIGNKPASGTAILEELGEEHQKSGKPIVYTSGDSVFQIACNEEIYSKEELYEMCREARRMLQGRLGVGRVIARPFVGTPGHYVRTGGRRDYSLPPIGETILDKVSKAGMQSLAVGKIEDIFDRQGITASNHAAGNPACIDAWLDYMKTDFEGICFTNLVDTDSVYGHRRDPDGFAAALAYIDQKLEDVFALMRPDDLLIMTADHGCDPIFKGTDHTREYIPLLVWNPRMKEACDLGIRSTFADIAATCAEWLGLPDRFDAISFMNELK